MTRLWAELGLTHHGSLERAIQLTHQVAKAGAHTLKVQAHHVAEGDETEVGRDGHPRGDLWARTAFSREQWATLCDAAHALGLQVVASVFCVEAIDLVAGLVDGWKVPSGQVVNGPLWDALGKRQESIAAAYGIRDYFDGVFDYRPQPRILLLLGGGLVTVDNVSPPRVQRPPRPPHLLLCCVSQYPTPLTAMAWGRVRDVSHSDFDDLDNQWGLSDHSGTIWPALMAATLGASVVEVHVTDGTDQGPDAASSITFEQLRFLADGFKAIDQVRNSGEWQPPDPAFRAIYEPRWFPAEQVMRKSTKGLPPEDWWKGR